MTDLTRAQISAMTGLPPSTLSRQLARFPGARSWRGRYTTSDSRFAAWLVTASGAGTNETDGGGLSTAAPREYPAEAIAFLPSGIPVRGDALRVLRQPNELAAIEALDAVVLDWKLRPHRNVPDALPFVPMTLPSGQVVNQSQWRILRRGNLRQAETALDVLIRSWSESA